MKTTNFIKAGFGVGVFMGTSLVSILETWRV